MSLMLSFAVHRHKQNELIQHIHKIYETYDLFYLIAISIQRIKQKNAHNFWVWLVQIDRRPKESHTHRKVPANFREFFFFFSSFFTIHFRTNWPLGVSPPLNTRKQKKMIFEPQSGSDTLLHDKKNKTKKKNSWRPYVGAQPVHFQ